MAQAGQPIKAKFGVRATENGASPAVFVSGEAKIVVPYSGGDGYSFENCLFTRAMLSEREKVNRSLEMSRENPLSREARIDMAISSEMKELKRAESVEQKNRQQLRNNSEELRALSEHLKLAAISKDLSEHMREFYKTPLQMEKSKAQRQQEAELERLQFLDEAHKAQMELKEQQIELHEALAAQMEQKRQRRKQECLQILADREVRMSLQQQVEKEEKTKQMLQEQAKVRKRQDMDRFIEEKNAYKELQKQRAEAELKKILDSQSQMDERKKKLDQERLELRRKQEEISQLLGQQISQLQADKQQKDNLLLDLLESEHHAKEDERLRQQQQQVAVDRMRTKEELDDYRRMVNIRSMHLEEQKRLEVAARKADSVDKQEAIEKQQKLEERQRRKEYGGTLLSMIKDNQRKRAEAQAEEAAFFNAKAKADREFRERILRERRSMLDTTPPAVLRYLPNHVLSEEDRKHFGVPKDKKN